MFREYIGRLPAPAKPASEDHSLDAISIGPTKSALLYPFPNRTALDLYHYYLTGPQQKSMSDLEDLREMLINDLFITRDLKQARFKTIESQLDDMMKDESTNPMFRGLGWKDGIIRIQAPVTKRKPIELEVPGLRYRSILKVVQDAVRKVRLLFT